MSGFFVMAFNHLEHIIKPKFVVAGIYGAGGDEASDNPRLQKIVEKQGGKMFTSSWGTNDQEIIDYLTDGYKEGKQIKIYGHSRGGAAAVRIANVLGDMNIHVAEVNLFDPVSLGGDFVFTHPNVLRVNNYYQRNSSDLLSKGILGADNPFIGSPVKAKFSFPIINQVNYTGQNYRPGVPVSHLNIIRKAYGL